MKHIKPFKSFLRLYESSELSPEIRDLLMKELEKLIILPEIYHSNIELWNDIIDGVPPDDVDHSPLSRSAYLRHVREAKRLHGTSRGAFMGFMSLLHGMGGPEWDDMVDYSLEDYEKEFGVSRDIAEIMKSLYDGELIITPRFERSSL